MTTTGAGGGKASDDRDLGAFIPSHLDDYPLDVWEFRIYARAARRAGQEGKCFESVPNLARSLGCSDRTAQYALCLLVHAGLLRRKTRKGKTTLYSLTKSSSWLPDNKVEGLRKRIRPQKKDTPAADAPPKVDSTPAAAAPHPRSCCTPTPAAAAPKGSPFEGSPLKVKQQPGGCDIAVAKKTEQGVPEKIIWPENLLPHEKSLAAIIKGIQEKDREAFLTELSQAVDDEKVKKTPTAYAVGMLKRGWQPAIRIENQGEMRAAATEEMLRADRESAATAAENAPEDEKAAVEILQRLGEMEVRSQVAVKFGRVAAGGDDPIRLAMLLAA